MRKLVISAIALLLFFSNPFIVLGQEGVLKFMEQRGEFFKSFSLKVKKNILYANLDPTFTASSISISYRPDSAPNGSYLFLGESDKQFLKADADAQTDENKTDSLYSSQLLIGKKIFNIFSLYSGNLEGTIIVKLLYAPPLGPIKTLGKVKKKSKVVHANNPKA